MPAIAQAAERSRSRMEAAITGAMTKTEADYRPASSSERCGKCDHGHFQPGEGEHGRCEIVAGPIDEAMTCDYFTRQRMPERHGVSTASQLPDALPAEDQRHEASSEVDEARAGHNA